MTIMVEVKVINDSTGLVEAMTIKTVEGQYGYDIVRIFEKMGEQVAATIDPDYFES